LKFTKSGKNASKNEIYLQEIYQSSNQEMQTLNWTNQCPLFMTVRHIFEISEDDHPSLVTHARDI
jgi:2'-5' RNA ligase